MFLTISIAQLLNPQTWYNAVSSTSTSSLVAERGSDDVSNSTDFVENFAVKCFSLIKLRNISMIFRFELKKKNT